MIAIGFAEVVLQVTDQSVVPVNDIERPVGCDLNIDGAEVTIITHHDWVDFNADKARALFDNLVVQDASIADAIGDEIVALHFRWEVATGNHCATPKRTSPFWIEGWKLVSFLTTGDRSHSTVLATTWVFQRVIDSPSQGSGPVTVAG